ncbi:MAG: hypothetical protein AAGA93_24455 [Actinomycetota bacterium]
MAGRPLNETELDAYDVLPRALAAEVRVHHIRALPGGYAGMAIGSRVVLARPIDDDGTSALLAHELVHVRQWSEQGRVRFAARYVSSFARNFARHRRWSRAYRSIEAEEEARAETTAWIRRRARRAAAEASAPDRSGSGRSGREGADDGDRGHQG